MQLSGSSKLNFDGESFEARRLLLGRISLRSKASCMYRKGRAEDCQQVYDLICEMEGKKLPYEDFSVIYAEQLEDAKRCYLLICELEGKVAGMLNLRFERQLHHAGPIAEIMEFVVDPALRSQGVGSGMFEEACRIAHEAGCS